MERVLNSVKQFGRLWRKNSRVSPIELKGKRVILSRKKRKKVKFSNKEKIWEIPTWKCWSLIDTDLCIEFTYGPAKERIFMGHSNHLEIYCVLPPCSKEENLQELQDNMLWECVYTKNFMVLGNQSLDDVKTLLSIFLLAYWSKAEMEICDIVLAIHERGVKLGSENFGYSDPLKKNRQTYKNLVTYRRDSIL
ncbi:hypothetical protein LOD99_13559 [Oopsacas minuta]|uniref:Uncharacterized protein n=1 Tax=Oopsacas minuta TaxID=111878 RepID=A0AAV7KJC0_9METZ|nr:hypothetical protein LOD99_13559 [Oopsacas minuta]